jgi:imidazolonepropionase-like amidohydrolase
MRDLGVIERGYVHVVAGRIAAVGAGDPPPDIETGASDRGG